VPREELSARCWHGRVVGEDALNRCIARLRRLADATGDFKVETIPRIGYRLTVDGPESQPAATDPTSANAAPEQVDGRTFAKLHTRRLLLPLIFVLAAVAIGAYFVVRGSHRSEASLERRTFLVLPFAALNDDSESQHFAQSVTASVSNVLTRAGKRLVSPAQAQKFRNVDRARITEEAGARFIVDGEIRREGELISVMVRLDDGRTGRTLMSNVFQRNATEAAGLADIVAGYVGVRAWAYEGGPIQSDHAEVQDAGFRTVELLTNGESRAAYDLSVAMAQKYPDDAQALLMLSINTTFNYWALQQDEVAPAMRAARRAAKRVTEVAPHFGDIYIALSSLVPPQYWAQRENLLRKGVKIDPDARGVGNYLAGFLARVGRLRDAEQLARGAIGRDPFNLEKVLRQFVLLSMLGNRTDAAALVQFGERYVPGNPDFIVQRFIASDLRGSATEAATMMANPAIAAIIEPPERRPTIRLMLRALDSRSPADMDAAVQACTGKPVNAQTNVICLVGLTQLGRLDDVFAFASANYSDQRAATTELEDELWLRRERGFLDTLVLYRAELAPMRADPHFVTLAERIRLLDYWRAGHAPDFCASERAPVCTTIRDLGNP
jgi:TolB-like protein